MAIRFDQIQLSDDGHHLYPYIAGTDGYLAVQTASGLLRIGAANSSYSHFYTDRNSYYFNTAVSFDGNIAGYDGNETASFAIYYDSNDTSYYVNPASTSNLNDVEIVQAAFDGYLYHKGDTDTYFGFNTTDSIRFVAGNSEALLMSSSKLTVGDSRTDKVNIYGNLGIGHNNYPKVAYPGQNALWSGQGGTTGQIVIDLPGTLGNYDMMYMEIDVYEYSSDHATKIIVGGHNWNSGGNSNTSTTMWYNAGVRVIGSMSKPIYLGRRNDGSNERRCIAIGETTSTWSYATVHVHKVHGAEFYGTAIDWVGDWNIAQTTSTSYFTKNPTTNFNLVSSTTLRTHGRFYAPYIQAGTEMLAPIFYDSNDTSYYVNPGSTSVINSLQINDYIYHNGDTHTYFGFSGNDAFAMVFEGTTRLSLADSTDPVFSYSAHINMNSKDIDNVNQLHFNDNVRFYDDSNDSYLNFKFGDVSAGGIKMIDGDGNLHGYFYADGNDQIGILDNGGSWAVQVANDNITALKVADVYRLKCTTSEVQTYGILVNDTSVKAPIYYDSNDTNYYVDPNTTGDAVKIKGSIRIDSTHSGGNLFLYYQHSATDTTNSGTLTGWVSEPGITYADAGIGANIHQSGPYYGRAINSGYGVYINFKKSSGEMLFKNTTATSGNSGGQGTTRMTIGSSGDITASSSFRAPLFYDSGDTNYYCDPNGQSRLSTLNLGSSPTSGITSGYIAQFRGSLHMTNNNIDYVNQLHFHDNVRFVDGGNDSTLDYKYGDTGYGQIKFKNGSGTATGTLYAESGYFGTLSPDQSWAVQSSNTLTNITHEVRSPKFIDQSNTNYYLDPDSTNTSLNVAGHIYSGGVIQAGTTLLGDTVICLNGSNGFHLRQNGTTNVIAKLSGSTESTLEVDHIKGLKLDTANSQVIGYNTTNYGNAYGYLGVDVNGKLGVIEKEITFSIESTGWVGRHSNPVKLLDAPGADKMIVVQEINILINYSAPLGIGSNGICQTNDNTAYAIGFYQGSGTNGNFTVTGVMPRATMQYTTTTNDRIVNRDVPVEGTKLYPNKALYWKTTRNAGSSFGQYPGAQHIVKVRYRIVDVSTEFTGAYASAQNINSSSITSISQAY